MSHRPLDQALLLQAFGSLDAALPSAARLVIGGGAAMVLAYDHALAPQDAVDAFTPGGSPVLSDLGDAAKATARQLDIEPGWLNPSIEAYTHVLPPDYPTRLRRVFEGTSLVVDALGPEDLLLLKCFAGRDKDRPHARALMHTPGLDLGVIDRHLSTLQERRHRGADRAADFFDDLRDEGGA